MTVYDLVIVKFFKQPNSSKCIISFSLNINNVYIIKQLLFSHLDWRHVSSLCDTGGSVVSVAVNLVWLCVLYTSYIYLSNRPAKCMVSSLSHNLNNQKIHYMRMMLNNVKRMQTLYVSIRQKNRIIQDT